MDITIICTVTDNTDKKNGNYWVTDGAAKFIAKTDANSRYYNVGDTVRVLAIKGDLGNCYISGKYSQNADGSPLTYISPTETVVSMTDNLVPSKVDAWGITANGADTQICLWSTNLTSADYKDLQTNSIYNTISLQADFKCLLANYRMKSGTYGLILRLGVRSTNDNGKLTYQWVSLDSTDMFGNPYSFMVYSTQEATFDISELGTIEHLSLWLYQNNDFEYYDDTGKVHELPAATGFNNILVKDIYLSFGSDLTKVEDNTLQIYTGDTLTYNVEGSTDNSRDMGLLWYNKDEDNTYIGFSDGLYDPDYDELEYLDISEVDSRLTAQLGKDVPTDEAGLEVSADLEEAQPLFKSLRNSLTRDLRNNIYAYQEQIQSLTQFKDDFNYLLNLISNTGKKIEEYQETMNEEYAAILSAARKIQDGTLAEKPQQTVTIVDVGTKVNALLDEVTSFLAETKAEIKENYSGFMSVYDTYETRITKVQTATRNYLTQLNMLLNDDKGKMDTFFTPDYEFESYVQTDFSDYDNKYCIYWYRYEPGYYDVNERFLEKGWHRLEDKNLGLPRERLSEDSEYNAKKTLSPEGILTRNLDTKYTEEKYTAILFFNHSMFKSNIITFTNENPPVDEKIADQSDACRIEHGENSQPSYQMYGLNNLLVNAADGYRKRKILLRYDGLTAGDEALYEAQIFWYIPKNSTMLKYELEDFDASWSNDANADPGVTSEYSKTGYVCFYKTIGGNEIDERVEINDEDRYFTYRIKDYYSQSFTNNTIYCRIVKANHYDYEAQISFVFSSFGTSGTDYSLVISPNTEKAAADSNIVDGANLSLGIALYDYNNERIKILDNAPAVDNLDPYLSGLEWIGPSGYYAVPTYIEGEDKYGVESINITMNEEQGPKQKYYNGILKATVPYMVDDLDQLVELITVYTVPYTAGNYYIEGPGVVVYNSDGTNPTYYKNPFKIFKRDDDSELTDVVWKIMHYNEDGDIMTNEMWGQSEYAVLQSYMPKLDSKNCLVPCNIYLENNGSSEVYPVVICEDNDGVVIWAQPIYCMKNRYASAMVNQWDGSLMIDEENGTIMSAMVGAGRKNSQNQFEGILMGDVGSASEDNATGVGLYGFHEGAQSFNFNVDGTAFIGKSGRGRIKFNGNTGTITSASYEQTKESAGMMIDLDDGVIDMRGAKLDTDSGEYVADTNSNIHIDVKSPYFKITSNKGNNLMFVGTEDEGYYLQSDDFEPTVFNFNETASNSQGKGMKIDLKNGRMDAYEFTLASKNIYLNSGDDATKYFVIKDNDNNMILHAGKNEYYMKSADYTAGEAGTMINLSEGKIDSYDFKLTSSKVILSTESPYFKIDGSDRTLMYVSDDDQYIQDNSGNMTIDLDSGSISASNFDLSAGGLSLSSNRSKYPIQVDGTNNFYVDWAGNVHCENLQATGGSFTGTINASDGTFSGDVTGATIIGSEIYIPSKEGAKFSVDGDGRLIASSGNIGGWEVQPNNGGLTGAVGNAFSVSPTGLNFNNMLTVDENGKTRIKNLEVIESMTAVESANFYIKGANNFYITEAEWIYLSADYIKITGAIGIGGNPYKTAGGIRVAGDVSYIGDIYCGDPSDTTKGVTEDYTVKTGWFKSSTLHFTKGILTKVDSGDTDSTNLDFPAVNSSTSGKFLSNNGSSLLWKSIGLSVVSNANNTSLGDGISSALGTTYSVVVEDEVSASIPYSGTASGVWLGWDDDSTGRIYSSEYSSSSAASRHKYYTYASGQGYSGTAKGDVSARLVGSILAKVTSD